MNEETKTNSAIIPQDNLSVVEKTDQLLKAITEQNQAFKENLARQEELYAKLMLGGKSVVHSEEVKTETPKEYAARVMKGGFNKLDK